MERGYNEKLESVCHTLLFVQTGKTSVGKNNDNAGIWVSHFALRSKRKNWVMNNFEIDEFLIRLLYRGGGTST